MAEVIPDGSFPWYALYVKTHHEKLVSTGLRGKGYTEFLPLYRARHRSSGRFKDVDLPLLPNYVFCRFRPDRRTPILSTPGVFQIVAVAGVPAAVDETEIASLQRVANSGICARPWPFLKAGDRVRIEEGPLRGTEGILEASKGEARLVVSITLLQRSVAVSVDRCWVRPQGSWVPRCDEPTRIEPAFAARPENLVTNYGSPRMCDGNGLYRT